MKKFYLTLLYQIIITKSEIYITKNSHISLISSYDCLGTLQIFIFFSSSTNNVFLMKAHAICFCCQENPMIMLKTSITSLSSCLLQQLCYIGSCRFIYFCYANSFVSGMKKTSRILVDEAAE